MGERDSVPRCPPHDPHEREPLSSSPRANLARVTVALAPGESSTPPGLPQMVLGPAFLWPQPLWL